MLIRYMGGAGRRVISIYTWDAGNHFVTDVTDAKLAADLLTTSEFKAADGAARNRKEVKEVADALDTSPEQVAKFIDDTFHKPGR